MKVPGFDLAAVGVYSTGGHARSVHLVVRVKFTLHPNSGWGIVALRARRRYDDWERSDLARRAVAKRALASLGRAERSMRGLDLVALLAELLLQGCELCCSVREVALELEHVCVELGIGRGRDDWDLDVEQAEVVGAGDAFVVDQLREHQRPTTSACSTSRS